MKITFLKKSGHPDQLHYLREDGTEGMEELSPNSVLHDLAHFVVERKLGISEGFWGMIEIGHSIASYNLPNAERPFQISEQGYRAEFLATLLQSATALGRLDDAYVEMLRNAAEVSGLPFPALPAAFVMEEMQQELQELHAQWHAAKEALSLEFKLQD